MLTRITSREGCHARELTHTHYTLPGAWAHSAWLLSSSLGGPCSEEIRRAREDNMFKVLASDVQRCRQLKGKEISSRRHRQHPSGCLGVAATYARWRTISSARGRNLARLPFRCGVDRRYILSEPRFVFRAQRSCLFKSRFKLPLHLRPASPGATCCCPGTLLLLRPSRDTFYAICVFCVLNKCYYHQDLH